MAVNIQCSGRVVRASDLRSGDQWFECLPTIAFPNVAVKLAKVSPVQWATSIDIPVGNGALEYVTLTFVSH